MITTRLAPLRGAPAPAAVTAVRGDWPGPAMNDLPYLEPVMVAW
jgi:hypothetical protein